MSKLPRDIIVDILLRLPVKSLIRFKCVCKPWHPMITDSQFAKMRLKRAMEDDNLNHQRVFLTSDPLQSIDYEAFGDDDNHNVILELNYPVKWIFERSVEIVGSCNGLICLVFDYDIMILWNPTTGESKELPRPGSDPDGKLFYGFGYDFSINSYKVVRGLCSTTANGSNESKVEVFTLKSNIWRRIEYLHSNIGLIGQGTLSNGALHWLGRRGSNLNLMDVIVSFDLEEEKFLEVVPLPDYFDQKICVNNLGILGDCLVIFCNLLYISHEAWVMKEYCVKESWTRLFSVQSEKLLVDTVYPPALVCFTKDGRVLLDLDARDIDGNDLVMYNPKEETIRCMVRSDQGCVFEAAIYVESLVSPNADDNPNEQDQTQMEERRKTGKKRGREQGAVVGESN